MDTQYYYFTIVQMLKGETPELLRIHDRLDWGGSGAVLQLYNETVGQDRENFIRAMGKIIREAEESPALIAQLVHIASSLNITQVEPSVKSLSHKTELVSEEPLRTAVDNFFSCRKLHANEHRRNM